MAERLVHDHPEVFDYRLSLISAHGALGWIQYRLLRRDQDAYRSYRKGLDLAEVLARENPGLETARSWVEYFDGELGRTLARLGRPDEALEHYRRALAHREESDRRNPGVVHVQRSLAYLDYEMGRIHLAAGRAAEASSALGRARKLFEGIADSRALTPYDRACAHALCAGLIEMGKTDVSPQDQARRRTFAERAIANLREAISGGLQNPEMIASDIDFEAVSSSEDFRALMAELKARARAQSTAESDAAPARSPAAPNAVSRRP